MARIFIARDLEQRAASLIVDTLSDIAADTEKVAKQLAPPTKIWRTQRDALVRPEHRRLEGEETVDGLRFEAKSYDWDRKNRGLGVYTYLLAPRDRTSRSYVHVDNCRCYLEDGTGVADGITRSRPSFGDNQVSVDVVSASEWAVEAEYGTVYPNNQVAKGSQSMARTAATMRARLGVS